MSIFVKGEPNCNTCVNQSTTRLVRTHLNGTEVGGSVADKLVASFLLSFPLCEAFAIIVLATLKQFYMLNC